MTESHLNPSLVAQLLAEGTPHLRLFHRSGRPLRVRMPGARCLVGRGVDCDIRLPDARGVLSRHHLLLERRGGGVRATDLSRNGSWLEGEPMSRGPQRLRPGQSLSLGDWSLVLEGAAEAREERTTAGGGRVERVGDLVGSGPAMAQLQVDIERSARFAVPVLIGGETGTGKELVARAIHACSPFASGPFVAVNCGAIPAGTSASELFGHVRGAFTGATEARLGAFRRAEGGTLFLDEIAELPLGLQASLLRVLEAREVLPLGAEEVVPVHFRLVTATHRDLARSIENRDFREDLYYRVNVISIGLPPLRERREDILLLARHFAEEYAEATPITFSAEARDALLRHDWPGNVRELRNCVLRGIVASSGSEVGAQDLSLSSVAPRVSGAPAVLPPARPSADRMLRDIAHALQRNGGNRARAARDLGISRSTLYARMARLEASRASVEIRPVA
ncbi:MAG: sigma 54-interacting transcriptional regulator [Myxococcota bacterium]|nr:sigma 54-interacting transcriptional regulator [Myxococcota bacterium]